MPGLISKCDEVMWHEDICDFSWWQNHRSCQYHYALLAIFIIEGSTPFPEDKKVYPPAPCKDVSPLSFVCGLQFKNLLDNSYSTTVGFWLKIFWWLIHSTINSHCLLKCLSAWHSKICFCQLIFFSALKNLLTLYILFFCHLPFSFKRFSPLRFIHVVVYFVAVVYG